MPSHNSLVQSDERFQVELIHCDILIMRLTDAPLTPFVVVDAKRCVVAQSCW